MFKVSIKNNDKICNTLGFLDTGNRLLEEASKKPIVIINYKIFSQLFKNIKIMDLLLGKLENLPLKNCKYVSVNTVNGKKSKILTFEGEELKIFLDSQVNIIQDVTFGLALTKFEGSINYNVLLNPLLFDL